jgi:hypothetical protein
LFIEELVGIENEYYYSVEIPTKQKYVFCKNKKENKNPAIMTDKVALTACFVTVAGAAARRTCVFRIAAAARPAFGATILVSVLFAVQNKARREQKAKRKEHYRFAVMFL